MTGSDPRWTLRLLGGFQRGITQFTPSGYPKPVGSAGLSGPLGVSIFARRHRAKSTFSPDFWFGFILGHLEAISTPFWIILRPFWCHPDPFSAPKSASIFIFLRSQGYSKVILRNSAVCQIETRASGMVWGPRSMGCALIFQAYQKVPPARKVPSDPSRLQ